MENYFVSQGWECPKCKRVYSPTTMMCMYCIPKTSIATPSTPIGTPIGTPIMGSGSTSGTTHVCTTFVSTMDGKSTNCVTCGRSYNEHFDFINL